MKWGWLAVLLAARVLAADPLGGEPDPKPRVSLPDESMYSPSPQDGGGSVQAEPRTVQAGRPCTMTFTYTCGPKGVAVGGGVICYVSQFWFWGPPQGNSASAPGYSTVRCSNPDVTLSVKVDPGSQTIFAGIEGSPLVAGDRLTFVYGDTSGGKFPGAQGVADRQSERDTYFCFKVDGDGDGWFAPVEQQPLFEVTAGEAVRLAVFGPSRLTVGEPFEVRVSALDAVNNLAEGYTGKLTLVYDEEMFDAGPTVSISPEDRGSVGVRLVGRQPGLTRVAVQDASGTIGGVSNIMVLGEPADEKYRLCWGDLQIHGNLSDGTGTPEDIYRYARDVAGLDVAALTEHDHWGYLPLESNEANWQRSLDATDRYHEDGRFVAIYGYEWTDWTYGHQHVLFRRREQARVWSWRNSLSDAPTKLWEKLAGADCITIPHHCGGGPIPTCWKYHDPKFQPVVEIVSVHGVSERMGQAGCIRSPEPAGMVQAALARGYRLGFIGSGDSHDGHPGIGSPQMPPPGLAGIYATELTRDGIFEALRARRVYATNGCRAILRFHSGGVPMGGTIRLDGSSDPRTFSIAVVGDAPIAVVTVVKNNADVANLEGGSVVFAESWTDQSPAKTGDYYYVRIAQADGGWVWSSPIWVAVPE